MKAMSDFVSTEFLGVVYSYTLGEDLVSIM